MQEQSGVREQMLAALGLSPTEYFPFGPQQGFLQTTMQGQGGSVIGAAAASDERVKTNVVAAGPALEVIEAMEVISFDYTDPQFGVEGQVGMIAQHLAKLTPHAVIEQDGLKYVRYDLLVPVLIKAVQELTEEVRNGR